MTLPQHDPLLEFLRGWNVLSHVKRLVRICGWATSLLPCKELIRLIDQESVIEVGLGLHAQAVPWQHDLIQALNAMVQVLLEALILWPEPHAHAPSHSCLDHSGVQRHVIHIPDLAMVPGLHGMSHTMHVGNHPK